MRKILLVFMLLAATTALAVNVTASWTPPTEGSPVVEYQLYITADGEDFFTGYTPDTFLTITLPDDPFVEYVGVVRGKDAMDRWGEWSLPSDPYVVDPGIPGPPTDVVLEILR